MRNRALRYTADSPCARYAARRTLQARYTADRLSARHTERLSARYTAHRPSARYTAHRALDARCATAQVTKLRLSVLIEQHKTNSPHSQLIQTTTDAEAEAVPQWLQTTSIQAEIPQHYQALSVVLLSHAGR
jgi:hypothetical protein